jgi:hypothetical protein
MDNITSLDKCGLVQTHDCIKRKCPLWSEDGICMVDVSSAMFQNMTRNLILASSVWKTLDTNQKVEAGLAILKSMSGALWKN